MARATTSRGRELVAEAAAGLVDEDCALTPQRLGQQRHLVAVAPAPAARRGQRGRVELHELQVGERGAGPRRHGDTVADRLRRRRS